MGGGKFVCDYISEGSYDGKVAFSGDVTVADTATLAINAGKQVTTGAITVNDGATLQVAQSGTVALGGDLTLKKGASLGFKYTTRNEPVLNLDARNVMFDEGEATNIVVKISSDGGKKAKGGINVLTSGGRFSGVTVSLDPGAPAWATGVRVNSAGDIELNVKPSAFIMNDIQVM